MQRNGYEIIVLKPTHVFRSFLSVLQPNIDWPSLDRFLKDTTAYTLKKSHTNDALLKQIEYHYQEMLHHEVTKWVGEEVRERIRISFFDFLRFFKFEIHTQVMLMESATRFDRFYECDMHSQCIQLQ